MTNLRKAAEMALEALKANAILVNGDDKSGGLVLCLEGYVNKQTDEAITALRRALEQPAQDEQDRQIDQLIQERDHRDEIINKLCDAVLGLDRYEWSSQYFFEDAVREVEERMATVEQPAQSTADKCKLETVPAKGGLLPAQQCVCGEPETLGIHRTDGPSYAEQPAQQEPVAWMFEDDEDNGHKTFRQTPPSPEAVAYLAKWNRPAWVPLYTAPPQRTWVGLTEKEIDTVMRQALGYGLSPSRDDLDFARAIEAAHGIKGGA